MKKIFLILSVFFLVCEKEPPPLAISQVRVIAEQDSVVVDSIMAVLGNSEEIRRALSAGQINTNAAKRQWAEEDYFYTLVDSVEQRVPAWVGFTAAQKRDSLEAKLLRYTSNDSLDDRGQAIAQHALNILNNPTKLNRLKNLQFFGVRITASLDSLLAMKEQRIYKIFDPASTTRLQALKKLFRGRWGELQGTSFTWFIFENTAQMNNQLNALRADYDNTVILDIP